MDSLVSYLQVSGEQIFGPTGWLVIWNVFKIGLVILPILGAVAYATLYERKLIGWMHARLGPNRVGPIGLLQPIADSLKLMSKEIIIPEKANKLLYLLAPVLTIAPSLAAWAVIPFSPDVVLSNINAGLLFLIAATSLEVYGVILAGWASNSKYAFLAAMRASAQMVSYELAIGFSLVVVLMVSGSLNLSQIVTGQQEGYFANIGFNFLSWNWLPLLPILVIYFISGVAETNRHPFDVVEGESEIVAGHMVEYSGMAFAVFFLAEYANMILIAVLASIMFFGGWDSPLDALNFIPGWIWLGLKSFFLFTFFIWFRASFPRYRYDQIMRLGWKIFIPVSLFWLVVVAFWMKSPFSIWS
jgi:NADH-quinone oxidoreductase subunit H